MRREDPSNPSSGIVLFTGRCFPRAAAFPRSGHPYGRPLWKERP